MTKPILMAKDQGKNELFLLPKMANRHGLIAGATGTGKTVTLQVMAENFSRLGVPVFMADVKGDLAGISAPGGGHPKVEARVKELGLEDFSYKGCPVAYWDVFGELGHPVRTTISEMGPLLLSRLLNLNETQSGVVSLTFKVADDNGLLLLDLKDFRSMLHFVAENASTLRSQYGNVSPASVGAIQRSLLVLEEQGGDIFFGEPALDIFDFIQTDANGQGIINILAAEKLIHSSKIYATFLLWLLSELFEQLPEVGDLEKPKLIFFFDEAHLLFTDVPNALLEKIEQVVRIIRSKGVGVFFVTQNPMDIPEKVLGQLGNRVQHALRAYTPKDQKVIKTAAQTFRTNPALDAKTIITELGVGEALVSFLDEKGRPNMVQRALICPPESQIGPISHESRQAIMQKSLIFGHYEKTVDRESAYEILMSRAKQVQEEADEEMQPESSAFPGLKLPWPQTAQQKKGGRQRQSMAEAIAKSTVRSIGSAIGSQIGRQIIRGVLGSLFGGKR